MTISPADERLWEGIALFNSGEYFACHDVWEELWSDILGEERNFIKGLIHVTVALHHFTEGNPGGGRKMATSARGYLRAYPGDYLGLDVEGLLRELDSINWLPTRDGLRPRITATSSNTNDNSGNRIEDD